MIGLPPLLLACFPPSRDFLLCRASQQTDDAVLMVIAEADYGMNAKSTMQELRIIRDNGSVTAEVSGHLFEVLKLTRYSEPDDHNPFSKPDPYAYTPQGYSGHQARLFACTLLLRMHADPQHWLLDSDDKSTLGKCLVSAKVLGNELGEALARYLTWQISSLERFDETSQIYNPLLYSLALLILSMRLRPDRLTEDELGVIAEWVLAQESQETVGYPIPSVSFAFGARSDAWRALAAEFKDETQSIRDDSTRELLEMCQLILSED